MGDAARGPALPSFERPPVVEVAVGVHFLQLPGLNTVALLRLAQMWVTRFPIVREQPASPPPGLPVGPIIFQVQNALPPLRYWLLTDDESLLVQIQHDRLLLNWRQVSRRSLSAIQDASRNLLRTVVRICRLRRRR